MVKLFSKNSNGPTYVFTIHQRQYVTDRRTDRQTTCDWNTALCTKVHRAVIINVVATKWASFPAFVK